MAGAENLDNKPTPQVAERKRPEPKPVHPTAAGLLDARTTMDIAEKTLCEGCRLEGLTEECWTCPGPYEFVNALVEKAEFELLRAERDVEAAAAVE